MSFFNRLKNRAFDALVKKSEKSQSGMEKLLSKLKEHPELASGCFCDDATWGKMPYMDCCAAIQKAVKLGVHTVEFDPAFDLSKPFSLRYKAKKASAAPVVFIGNVTDQVAPLSMRFDVFVMPADLDGIAYLMTRTWWLTLLGQRFKDPAKAKEAIQEQLTNLQDRITQAIIKTRRGLHPELFQGKMSVNQYQQGLIDIAEKDIGLEPLEARCVVDELHQYLLSIVCRQNAAVNCSPERTSIKAYRVLTGNQPAKIVSDFIATYHASADFASMCQELWQLYPAAPQLAMEGD